MSKMIEVIVLRTDGGYEVKRLKGDYKAMGAEVGGNIELLPHAKPTVTAYVNEEGWLKQLECNAWTGYLREQGFAVSKRGVAGNIVLCRCDKKGNDCDVDEAFLASVRTYHNLLFDV